MRVESYARYRRRYLRHWRRNHRGRPWLNKIEEIGETQGMTLRQTVDKLLSNIVKQKQVREFLQ